jgi:hypothetical protein
VETDVHDMVAMWRTIKMLSPLLLMCIGGLATMMTYYMREMSKSMRYISEVIVKHESRFERHEDRLDNHDERIDRIERT